MEYGSRTEGFQGGARSRKLRAPRPSMGQLWELGPSLGVTQEQDSALEERTLEDALDTSGLNRGTVVLRGLDSGTGALSGLNSGTAALT